MRKLKRRSEIEKLKKKKRIKFKKQKCKWRNSFGHQCKRWAVGKSTLCEKHGGERIAHELLVSVHELPVLTGTKFNPAVHPMQFLEMSREGKSVQEIAAELMVTPETLKRWSETFKEFATAWEIGQACHEAWWLKQGKNNLTNTRFQTGLFKFLTTNKLGYAEKIETKSHNVNENVGVLLVPGEMSIDDWEKQNIEDDKEKEIIDI